MESYRQQIFVNVHEAMALCFQLLRERGIPLEHQENEVSFFAVSMRKPALTRDRPQRYEHFFQRSRDLKDREAFPREFYEPLRDLWEDAGVQECVTSATEASVPEK